MASPLPGPLAGVRVVDFSRVLSGPYCSMVLADLGAEVIKIEPVGTGDEVRTIPPFRDDLSHYFLGTNRNKLSLAVDLKQPDGLAAVKRLIAASDIVIENFRPGVLQRLGLGFDALCAERPNIVVCSITGFGSDGPWSERPAFDLVTQALSGLMSLTGEVDGEPMRAGIPIGDLAGGMWSAIGLLAALYAARADGKPRRVEVSMLDGLLALLGHLSQLAFLLDADPPRIGNEHHSMVPYGRFSTSDGAIVLALHIGVFWDRFVKLSGSPVLVDPKFADKAARIEGRADINAEISAIMARRSTMEWSKILTDADIPFAPVLGVREALNNDYVRAAGLIDTMHHRRLGPIPYVASPIRIEGELSKGGDCAAAPPDLGEHTVDVLSRIAGLDDEAIRHLLTSGTVQSAD